MAPHDTSAHSWPLRLLLIGALAAAWGWGINQVVVWWLEENAPQPLARAAAPPNTQPKEPIVSADFVVEEEPDPAPSTPSKEVPQEVPRAPSPDDQPEPAPTRDRTKKRPNPPADERQDASTSGEPRVRVFKVDKARLEKHFKSAEDVAAHGRVMPAVDASGERRGLKFVGVAPSGVFARLGIRNGDVIVSVNGTELKSQQKALSKVEAMRKMRTFDVILERGDQRRHHRYVLE